SPAGGFFCAYVPPLRACALPRCLTSARQHFYSSNRPRHTPHHSPTAPNSSTLLLPPQLALCVCVCVCVWVCVYVCVAIYVYRESVERVRECWSLCGEML